MTKGPIARQMISFAVPIFLGQLFQQLYNTVDSLIVGNTLGSHALAAVSSSGNIIMLLVGFFNGMSMGASVVISQSFGAKNYQKLHETIVTTVTFGFLLSIVLALLGTWLVPYLLQWMGTPEEVMPLSIEYFGIYFAGIMGLVMYNQFTGILRAVGDSKHPLYFLICSSLLNVVLDLFFILVCGWGVGGAAMATVISQFISALLAFYTLVKTEGPHRIEIKKLRLYKSALYEIVRYGIPTGVQNSIISLANVVVQSQINSFGSYAMAGIGAYSKLEGFVFLPIQSFNMATSTFVGQNIGAREYDRTLKGAKIGILGAMAAAELVGIVFFIFAPNLVALFDSTPEVVAFGVSRARWNCLFYFLLAYSHAVSAVLRGAGKPAVPMYVMLVCWCLIRITVLWLISPWHNILYVNLVYPLTWSLSSLFFIWYYYRKTWLKSAVETAEKAAPGTTHPKPAYAAAAGSAADSDLCSVPDHGCSCKK